MESRTRKRIRSNRVGGTDLSEELAQDITDAATIDTINNTILAPADLGVADTGNKRGKRGRHSAVLDASASTTDADTLIDTNTNTGTQFHSQSQPEFYVSVNNSPFELEFTDHEADTDTNTSTSYPLTPQYMVRPAPADLPKEYAIANPFNPLARPAVYGNDGAPVDPSFRLPSRGYLAYFFWDHYRYQQHRQSLRPPFTYLTASIPTIFQAILDILNDIERDTRGIEILPLMDKRILKPLGIRRSVGDDYIASLPQTYDNYASWKSHDKIRLIDGSRSEYQITAARKDQLPLIFEPNTGILAKLGLCPLLIDVYFIQGATKQLVAGGGPHAREHRTNPLWRCTCTDNIRNVKMNTSPTSQSAVVHSAESLMEDESLAVSTNSSVSSGGTNASHTDAFISSSTDIGASVIDELKSPLLEFNDAPLTSEELSLIDPLMDDTDALDDTVTSTDTALDIVSPQPTLNNNVGAAASVPLTVDASPFTATEREKWKRKLSVAQRALSQATETVKNANQNAALWEEKFKSEKDMNQKLWDRIVVVQRQLRHMSRPLTTALASQGRL